MRNYLATLNAIASVVEKEWEHRQKERFRVQQVWVKFKDPTSWRNEEIDKPEDITKAVTVEVVGWVVHEDDKELVIACFKGDESDGYSIPKGCVLQRERWCIDLGPSSARVATVGLS